MTQQTLRLAGPMLPLDDLIISKPTSLRRAFTIAADLGQLEDKRAAAAAGLDPATWSKFKQGGDRAPGYTDAMFDGFFDVVGNELPLHYLAWRRGHYLLQRESELERLLRKSHEANDKLTAENELLKGLVRGGRV